MTTSCKLAPFFAVGVLAFASAAVLQPLAGQGDAAVQSLGLVETWSSDEVEARAETAYVPWHRTADGDFLASRTDPATDVPTVVRLRLIGS